MRLTLLAALALVAPILVMAAPASEQDALSTRATSNDTIPSTCDDEFCDRREFFYADSSFLTANVCDGFCTECYKRASSSVQLHSTCRAHPDQAFVRFQCIELRKNGGAWSGTSEVGKTIGLTQVKKSDGRCNEIYPGLCEKEDAPDETVQLRDPFSEGGYQPTGL